MTPWQDIDLFTQCAGVGCVDQKKCARFNRRVSQALWASFDIERKAFPNEPCPHKIWSTKSK